MLTVSEIMDCALEKSLYFLNVHAAGVVISINSEREEFISALKEYFFCLISPRQELIPSDSIILTYSHDHHLFFKGLEIASRFRVTERVEFHPDNFYEIIYRDDSGELLESRGGIRHLIFRSTNRRHYCIITPDWQPEILEFHKPGIRLIREFAFRIYQNRRYFPLHASAASNGSEGYLFVGDSGAGKSTLAANISAFANAGTFVSSDITLLKAEGAGVSAVGWPGGGISLGIGTLEALRCTINEARQHAPFKHEEGYVKKGKFLLTPTELSNIFNIKIVENISIKAIIFPSINLEKNSFCIKKVSPECSFQLAIQQLRNSLSDTYRYGVYDVLRTSIQAFNTQAIQDLLEITSMIPAYAIEGHPLSIARHLVNEGL